MDGDETDSSEHGTAKATQLLGQQADSRLRSLLKQRCSGILGDLATLEEVSVEHNFGAPPYCGLFMSADCRALFTRWSDETPVALMGMGLDFLDAQQRSPTAEYAAKVAIRWLETRGEGGCSGTSTRLSLENGSAYAAALELLPFSLELRDRLAARIVDGCSNTVQPARGGDTSGAQQFPRRR